MIRIVFLMLAITLLNCEKQDKDEAKLNRLSSLRGYQNWYIGNFRCGVFVPHSYDASRKYPLIVIFHGHSDTTSWDYRWYNEPFVTSDPCIVLSPKCPEEEEKGWGNSWDPTISPMMEKTFEMMELAKRAFNLDTNRFYIHGTSMGAIGIYGVLQKKPGLFTAAYLECGAGNTAIAPLLVNTPLWIFHGSYDYVVPVYPDRLMYQSIRDHGGIQVRYTEYEGVGHNVWDYTRYEKTLPYWLLAQCKGISHSVPDSVQSFSATLTPAKEIKLQWTSPLDNKNDNQVWYYKIYRNGDLIAESDSTGFNDKIVNTSTMNAYQVSVVNFFFGESQRSKARFIKVEE